MYKNKMDFEVLEVHRNRKLNIPRDLNLVECWGLVKSLLASEVGGGFYTPVPYLTETSVYKIGYIFVTVQNATGCCGGVQKSYKILGPLNKYVNDSYTTPDWCDPQLPTIKTTADFLDFKVRIGKDGNEIIFHGYDYHQLRLSELMRPIETLRLNRDSHEDLGTADRFGLISGVGVIKKFEIRVSSKKSARVFFVGDDDYTVLFNYQICQIDSNGVVVAQSNGRPTKNPWLSLRPETCKEDLPLWEPDR